MLLYDFLPVFISKGERFMKSIEVAPSILSADFRILEKEVKDAEQAGADRIHCDVMDGHFVPNLTFGPFIVEAVKKSVSIPLDVHLMISEPEKYADSFCSAGADVLTFHSNAVNNIPSLLEQIKKQSVKVGVAVNPDISIDTFLTHLDKIDQVLIMTVYAGFGGQKFIHECLEKIEDLFRNMQARGVNPDVQVDGGIDNTTAPLCTNLGVNVLVAGSYIFGSSSYKEKIQSLKS